MDMDGIPISFSIYPGNRNEQTTMIPLEKKMISDFDMSKFIVCTDAGLSSATNRVFNTYDKTDGMRAYITTQPIKTLKDFLQEWCLEDDGWYALHEAFGFCTSKQIVPIAKMRNIISQTKK